MSILTLNPEHLHSALEIVISIALLAYALWELHVRRRHRSPSNRTTISNEEKQQLNDVNPYEDITPLPEFEWNHTLPLQIRAFKPKFYMTMGKGLSSFFETSGLS